MLLAVVANSDGRAEAMASAMEVFVASAVDLVVHCGDVGGRHVLDAMNAPVAGDGAIDCAFVWGDRDRDRMGLLRYAQSINITYFGVLGELEIDEKKIVVVHGDDRKLMKKILDEQQYDYVLIGHDLWAEDKTVGRTRILNPGPLHGAAGKSALLLEPASGKMRLLAL